MLLNRLEDGQTDPADRQLMLSSQRHAWVCIVVIVHVTASYAVMAPAACHG